MTLCSLNEVEAVLTKAARGCGADAANAASFARAAVTCLCTRKDAGPIHAALEALPASVINSFPAKMLGKLAQPIEGRVVFEVSDALQAGYVSSLPYKYERVSDTEYLVHLGQFDKATKPARLEVDPQDMAQWQTLAARTYVPESAQSRLAGAGAGLTDND